MTLKQKYFNIRKEVVCPFTLYEILEFDGIIDQEKADWFLVKGGADVREGEWKENAVMVESLSLIKEPGRYIISYNPLNMPIKNLCQIMLVKLPSKDVKELLKSEMWLKGIFESFMQNKKL